MSEWVYKESKTVKIYFLTVFLIGLFFLLFVLFNISLSTNVTAWVTFFLGLVLWSVFGMYEYFNLADVILISDSFISIEWSSTRKKEYPFYCITVKKIGFGSEFLCVKDDSWKIMNYKIPRLILLDGFSAEYKQLLNKIKEIRGDRDVHK